MLKLFKKIKTLIMGSRRAKRNVTDSRTRKNDNILTKIIKDDNNFNPSAFFLIATTIIGMLLLLVPLGLFVEMWFNHTIATDLNGMAAYIVAVVVLVVSVGVHLYTSGDIISYIKARESLKEYITEVYPDSVFKIVNAKYTFYKTKSYTFEVRNISKNVNTNFIVLKDKNYSVYDEYKFNVQSQNTTKLNESFDAYVKEINTNLTFKIGYLDSGEAKLLISKEVESVDKETQDQFVTEVVEFISNLKKFNENGKIKFVEIYLKDKTNNENSVVTDFTLKDIYNSNNMYEYIQNSLTVEIIG